MNIHEVEDFAISHCLISNNQRGDKCLSIGEKSTSTISNSSLNNCLIGIAVKDESSAVLDAVSFSGNREAAIALYRKNPRYSGGGTISGQKLSGISPADIQVGKYSTSNIPARELQAYGE